MLGSRNEHKEPTKMSHYLVHLSYFLDSLLNWNMVVDYVPGNEPHNYQIVHMPLTFSYPAEERVH